MLFSLLLIFFIMYTWLIFPILIYLLGLIRSILSKRIRVSNNDNVRSVSYIIAAHNEEKNIKKRVENILSQNLTGLKYEILIGSDGSSDNTVKTVSNMKNVVVYDFIKKRGRALVHNDLIKNVKNDIIIFTDAETRFDEQFTKNII